MGSRNIAVLRKLLWRNGVLLHRHDLGGTQSRTMSLALASGEVLQEEFERQARGWISVVRAEVLRLLLLLARDWEPSSPSADIAAASPRNLRRVMPAVDRVSADPGGHLQAEEAAASCGLSVAQFNRVFRQVMNMSYHEFVLRYRLAAAAKQVLATDVSLEEIAGRAGFCTSSRSHRDPGAPRFPPSWRRSLSGC